MATSDNFQRLGRKKHPVHGPGVEAIYRLWDGEKGREYWEKAWFPVDQRQHTLHPRCPTGYNPDFDPTLKPEDCPPLVRVACVSKSVSFYEELCRYGSFRWK